MRRVPPACVLAVLLAWPALGLSALGLSALGLSALGFSALAQAPVGVRLGEHPGFSRLVLDLPGPAAPAVARDGNRLSIRLPDGLAPDLAAPGRRLPPGIAALAAEGSAITLELAAGAELRQFRLGNRVVFDVLAPPSAPSAAAPAPSPPAQPTRPATAALPLPVPPAPPPPPETQARLALPQSLPPLPPAPAPTPVTAPVPATATPAAGPVAAAPPVAPGADPPAPPAPPAPSNNLPLEEALPRTDPPQGAVSLAVRPAGEAAISLPFDARTGIALFRRGASWWIVLDEPRPLDLAPLRRHPKFAASEITVAAAATLLRVPLPPGQGLRARREGPAWLVETVEHEGPPAMPLRAAPSAEDPARLMLAASAVGRSVALRDPATGETLLVGAVRDAALGIAPARAYVAFSLPPTAAGLLVVPQSDSVQLRALADGFVVSAAPVGAGVAIAAAGEGEAADGAAAAAAGLTRRFDLAAVSEAAQAERIRRLAFETGAAAPLARARLRMETAEALLSLGMGAEAQGVLELAAADDPAAARTPRLIGLAAVAALVAGRVGESGGLADPKLDGTDEIALWRALRALAQGQPDAAVAPVLAATAPLVATYGGPLRRRLVPLLAESMAGGGEAEAASRLLRAADGDPELTLLARARVHAAKGELDDARAAYDEAARGRDRLVRARALSGGIELALASGRIDAAEAANRLDAALYAWRGDGMEIAQRRRVAALRMQAGDARGALVLLRETLGLFPEEDAALRPLLAAAFRKLFGEGAADALTPLQAVTLFEDNVDLLAPGAEGEAMIARLADRLLQLDLPGRAAALVARVMDAHPQGEARAVLGARLASMRLADNDPLAARAALAASAADGLPPSLVRERRRLDARALAASGDVSGALAVLGAEADPPALDLRAAIAAAAGDWAGAVPPLAALAATELPPPGAALDAAQRRTLLRLATAAALAGQNELLARLARERGEAMRTGPLSEPFRLLTADPLQGAADLPRMAAELQLARGLPQTLAAVAPASR